MTPPDILLKPKYVLQIESIGDCAGSVTVACNGNKPIITELTTTYGHFRASIDITIVREGV